VVTHEVSEDAAEREKLLEQFERLTRVGSEQSQQYRLVALCTVLRAEISDRIADGQSFSHEEVEEAINDAATIEHR
jgi:hypothetical protein